MTDGSGPGRDALRGLVGRHGAGVFPGLGLAGGGLFWSLLFHLESLFCRRLGYMPREEAMIGPMTTGRPRFDVVAGRSESGSD